MYDAKKLLNHSDFFASAVSQAGVKDTPRNRKVCKEVIDWLDTNVDELLTVRSTYGATSAANSAFVDKVVNRYKQEKYGSIMAIIVWQVFYALIKWLITTYFFSSPAPNKPAH